MDRKVVLRDERNKEGSRHLTASINRNGDLVIEGQDLGPGVEAVFGPGVREYEWLWTVRKADLSRLEALLGASLLPGLKATFSGERAAGLLDFLDANGIPFERHSRLGD